MNCGSEGDAETELRQTLLALARIARECPCLAKTSGECALARGIDPAVAIEVRGVLRVEEIEDLADHFHAVVVEELELLRQANVELREGAAAQAVDVRHARRKVKVVTVFALPNGPGRSATDIGTGPLGVRRAGVIAEDAGGVDAEWRSVEATERDAMLLIGVQRSYAGA